MNSVAVLMTSPHHVATLKVMSALPVFTGEIGDTWVYGVQSDPYKVAAMRAISRARRRYIHPPKHDLNLHPPNDDLNLQLHSSNRNTLAIAHAPAHAYAHSSNHNPLTPAVNNGNASVSRVNSANASTSPKPTVPLLDARYHNFSMLFLKNAEETWGGKSFFVSAPDVRCSSWCHGFCLQP
jgi:hypothetical protein